MNRPTTIVEHPKCGRTWLRVCLLKYESLLYNTGKTYPSTFNSFNIKFSHKLKFSEQMGGIIYLTRDPRDTIVSYSRYSRGLQPDEWKKNHSWHEMIPKTIKKVFRFNRSWHTELSQEVESRKRLPHKIVHYEDMKKDMVHEFKEVLKFLKIERDDDKIAVVVEFSSFENMKRYQQENSFGNLGFMKNKVRRGIVGGYKDELTLKEIRLCNKELSKHSYIPWLKRYIEDV